MTWSKPLLVAGTTAHYDDALYYDHAYKRRRHDVRFYVERSARHGGPVLELGCGTGRITLELAKRGIECCGVDSHPNMLARAKERLLNLPRNAAERVRFVRGDLRRLRLKQKYPLVIAPFNVFMHLYSRQDIERALDVVKRHLADDGTFVFDVLMPDMSALARDPARSYKCRPIKHPTDGKVYDYFESFHYDPISQVQLVTMTFEERGRVDHTFSIPLSHRQFFPAELDALLDYNGFRVKRVFGDFDGSERDELSESQIYVCEVR